MNRAEAESLLRQMLGADKSFRDGQWEAIETAAVRKQRVLVVQRTGWGQEHCLLYRHEDLAGRWLGPGLADQSAAGVNAKPHRGRAKHWLAAGHDSQ